MRVAYLLLVWIHILAAMVWIGGAAFIALVLVPAVRKPAFAAHAPAILRAAAMRFRLVGWISLGILVLTGCLNLGFRGYSLADCLNGNIWNGAYGKLLALKLGLFAAMLAISGTHDFLLGPKAARLILEFPGSLEAVIARKRAGWMGRLVLMIALAIAGVAVLLVRGPI